MKTITISDESYEMIKNQIVEIEEVKKETKIVIRNRYDDLVIFESTKETIKEAVEEAVSESANLKYANLESAKVEFCTINFSKSEIKQAEQFVKNLKEN